MADDTTESFSNNSPRLHIWVQQHPGREASIVQICLIVSRRRLNTYCGCDTPCDDWVARARVSSYLRLTGAVLPNTTPYCGSSNEYKRESHEHIGVGAANYCSLQFLTPAILGLCLCVSQGHIAMLSPALFVWSHIFHLPLLTHGCFRRSRLLRPHLMKRWIVVPYRICRS